MGHHTSIWQQRRKRTSAAKAAFELARASARPVIQISNFSAMGVVIVPLVLIIAWVLSLLGVTAPGANPGEPFAENAMSWMLSLPVGAMFIVSGFMHTVFAKKTAANIGWQTNGFQYEIGFGSFGMGIAGFVAAGTDQTVAWVCVSIAASVFLLGAAANHFREMIKDKNFAPGNTIINISNIGLPVSLWALLFATGAV